MIRNPWKFAICCLAAGLTFTGSGESVSATENLTEIAAEHTEIQETETAQTPETDESVSSTEEAKTESSQTAVTETEQTAEVEASGEDLTGQLIFAQCEDYVNVRNGADTESEVVAKIYNHDSAVVLREEENGWFAIQSGNAVGYVKAEYFATGEDAQEIAKSVAYNVAAVQAEELNVRSEATTDSETITTAYKSDELEVVLNDGDWMKVALEGDVYGYVSADYVEYKTYYPTAETLEEEQERLAAEAESAEAAAVQAQAEAEATAQAQSEAEAAAQAQAEAEAAAQAQAEAEAAAQAQAEAEAAAQAQAEAEAAAQAQAEAEAAAQAQAEAEAAAQAQAEAEAAAQAQAEAEAAAQAQAEAEAAAQAQAEAEAAAQAQAEAEAAAQAQAEAEAAAQAQAEAEAAAQAQAEAEAAAQAQAEAEAAAQAQAEAEAAAQAQAEAEAAAQAESEAAAQAEAEASTSSTGQQIADYAVQFVGNPYVYGGTSLTSGADCSGFTQSVFANFGISLARVAADQAAGGTSVDLSSVQAGDLIFYSDDTGISHVGIYIGGGQIVHAANSSSGIIISSYMYDTPTCARRYC